MKKIIVKSVVTSHQKIKLIGFFLLFFTVGLATISRYVLYAMGRLASEDLFTSGDLIPGILFLLSFVLLAFAIAKEGLLLDTNKLYQSKFIFKRSLGKTEVDLAQYTDISALGQNLSQKYAFGASPNPDQAYSYKEYRVFLLNNNHSKKFLLASCKTMDEANQLISQIVEQVNLEYKQYDPPHVGRKRR